MKKMAEGWCSYSLFNRSQNLEEAGKAIDKIGEFPVMIKAIDNAASRGSKKIISYDELPDALEDAKIILLPELHWLKNLWKVRNIVWKTVVLMEFITITGWGTEYWLCPYAIEIGHVDPSRLSIKEQDELIRWWIERRIPWINLGLQSRYDSYEKRTHGARNAGTAEWGMAFSYTSR